MPRGPQGQWRPVSDTACATRVMKIATGEIEEKVDLPPPPLPQGVRNGEAGRPGGACRERLAAAN